MLEYAFLFVFNVFFVFGKNLSMKYQFDSQNLNTIDFSIVCLGLITYIRSLSKIKT
jgi:hypothetical protein